MNRRNLLRNLGGIGLASLLSPVKSFSGEKQAAIERNDSICFLTPQETEGPFYFDPSLVREDITEDTNSHAVKTGLPLAMLFTVVDTNCNPIPNVLVDIWHNDKDGAYSGYAGQPGGVNTIGQNFLRGIQVTDANGQCSFQTIYPGWYPGRVTHIHFKVRLSSTTYVTSQFAFPDNINTAVYNTPLYTRGQNSMTNSSDSIFQSANPANQIMAITSNETTGGYDGTYTIGINVPTGVDESKLNPEGFRLLQNYPNPFNPSTIIRYTLPVSSHVRLNVFDVFGREIVTLVDAKQNSGTYDVPFDTNALPNKLGSGFYFYKLSAGSFIEIKEMLLLK